VATWGDFDPEPILRALARREVDFVVIGGIAAVLHGSPEFTTDLDVAFASERENLEALGEALGDLDARLRGASDDVPFRADATTLRRVELLMLETTSGPLDLLRAPTGAPSYKLMRRRAERYDVGDFVVLAASIDDLIAMKRASGRAKDLAAIEQLEAILRLRSR
jgi:hypothetical protein